eukprot:NODE_36_length_4654_cov_21.785919_g29_i0.p1 GENE.NODE_36_length_4654_cov_21.785919_g29_i0~~NODE_36_length_4654_cov_21.785919_g29_i0.p1  ORF type:complete len:601 (+),score=149.13 NODE_36_length_4654_cov_21.785919_g29_i0:693-2495(+)
MDKEGWGRDQTKQVRDLEDKIVFLENALRNERQLGVERGQSVMQISELESIIKLEQDRVRRLEEENSKLTRTNRELDDHVRALERTMHAERTNLEREREATINQLTIKLRDAEGKLTSIERSLQIERDSNVELKKDNSQLTRLLQEAERTVKVLEEKVYTVERQIQLETTKLTDYERDNHDMLAQIRELESRVSNSERSLIQEKDRSEIFEKDNKQMARAMQELRQSSDQAQERIYSLEKALQVEKSKLDVRERDFVISTSQRKDLEDRILSLEKQLSSEQEKLIVMERDNKQMARLLQEAKHEAILASDKIEMLERSLAETRGRTSDTDRELLTLTSQIRDYDVKLGSLEKTITQERDHIKTLEKENAQINRLLQEAKRDAVIAQEKVTMLEKALQSERGILSEKERETSSIAHQVREYEAKVSNLERLLAQERERATTFESDNVQIARLLQEAKREVTLASDRAGSLEKSLQSERGKLEIENSRLIQQVRDYEARLSALDRNSVAEKDRLTTVERENVRLLHQVQDMEKHITMAEGKVAHLERTLENERREVSERERHSAQITMQVRDFESQTSNLERALQREKEINAERERIESINK